MDFVYSASDSIVAWGPAGSSVRMRPNDIWFADDPFVLGRPDLFSATPLVVHSSQGVATPAHTPLPPAKKAAKARA